MTQKAPVVPAASDDDDLAAGFASVTGTEPATSDAAPAAESETSAAEQFEQETDAPSQQPQADPQGEPAPWATEMAALRKQVEDLSGLNQTVRNIAGNVGGLKSQLQKLQTLPQGTPAAENAQKLVEDAIKEHISEEYPEFGDKLVKSLTKIVSSMVVQSAPAPSVDADAIEDRLMTRVERRALERAHPKWEDELALKDETGKPVLDPEGKRLPSPLFQEWLASKDEEFRKSFLGTNDSDILIPAIGEFKEFRASKSGAAPANAPAQATGAPAATPPAKAPAPSKQRRLAAATTPAAGASAPGRTQPTEDEDFAAGFRSVRGR